MMRLCAEGGMEIAPPFVIISVALGKEYRYPPIRGPANTAAPAPSQGRLPAAVRRLICLRNKGRARRRKMQLYVAYFEKPCIM
jgi:hypothetical protein